MTGLLCSVAQFKSAINDHYRGLLSHHQKNDVAIAAMLAKTQYLDVGTETIPFYPICVRTIIDWCIKMGLGDWKPCPKPGVKGWPNCLNDYLNDYKPLS